LRQTRLLNWCFSEIALVDLGAASVNWSSIFFVVWVIACSLGMHAAAFAQNDPSEEPQTLILAHYMPWYEAKPASPQWGWHWTMNHFEPESQAEGKRFIASKYYPLIGPYDSGDPHVLEYHLLLMKLAGIDGVIVDWYGLQEFRDYKLLHRNTKRLVSAVSRLGMKFAICYEDQTIGALVQAGRIKPDRRIEHAVMELDWVSNNWFNHPSYVRIAGHPLLLSFGQSGLTDNEWETCLAKIGMPVTYLSQHRRRDCAMGAFDWPLPKQGMAAVDHFLQQSEAWPLRLPVAFPRFDDVYEIAGVHPSWGFIADANGNMFRQSLQKAFLAKPRLIQIATWNDWGEGTQIEPSQEFGTRDLEMVQKLRQEYLEKDFPYRPEDLEIPTRIIKLRRQAKDPLHRKLDAIIPLVNQGKLQAARTRLQQIEPDDRQNHRYKILRNLSYRDAKNDDSYARERCRLDVYYPTDQTDFATIVWFHGGGLKGGNRKIPELLKDRGIAVVAVNYRLSPKVQSQVCIEDAAAAVAWTFDHIEQFGGARNQIFVSGHSAGGYLASMIGLDKRYLAAHDIDANLIAGLIPFSGHTITHMRVREERGIPDTQPVVDDLAPLFHLRKDAPPMVLITGDRELELLGRYEENAYFWRMMKIVGHPDTQIVELKGKNHGQMLEPGFPILLRFVNRIVDQKKEIEPARSTSQ
jgi:acetyl esterase/lipase